MADSELKSAWMMIPEEPDPVKVTANGTLTSEENHLFTAAILEIRKDITARLKELATDIKSEHQSSRELQQQSLSTLIDQMVDRIPCLKEIEELRHSNSLLQQDLQSHKNKLEEANEEIADLRAELQKYKTNSVLEFNRSIRQGRPIPFFPGYERALYRLAGVEGGNRSHEQ